MAAAKGMISVTKTKESPNQVVGVDLRQDEDGAVYVKKISKSGLFHHTELEVDDKVLSINGTRIEKGQTLEEYKEATLDNENLEKITIVAKKPTAWGKKTEEEDQVVFKKEFRLSAGGTPLPFEKQQELGEEEEKVQVMVKGIKEQDGQEVGVTFVKVGDKLFVSGIAPDSIFHPDKKPKGQKAVLEFGDRIASVNETNFMSYADAAFAEKLLNKRNVKECILYVEKGWNILQLGHVDPIHYDPTLVRGGKARYAPVAEEPKDTESEASLSSDSESEKEPEGSGIAKPNLKDVAPPPKDADKPLDGDKMWWDM